MKTPPPWDFAPELSADRLGIIARRFLDIHYEVQRDLQHEYDCNYTRGTTSFGRQKNMIVGLARGQRYSWLALSKSEMDVTFTIGGIPCRFFADDPEKPKKTGFFRRNEADQLFEPDDKNPVMWRFVIEKGIIADDETRVHLIGYNLYEEKVCEWTYRDSAAVLHGVDAATPAAVELQPAPVDLKTVEKPADSKTGDDE